MIRAPHIRIDGNPLKNVKYHVMQSTSKNRTNLSHLNVKRHIYYYLYNVLHEYDPKLDGTGNCSYLFLQMSYYVHEPPTKLNWPKMINELV